MSRSKRKALERASAQRLVDYIRSLNHGRAVAAALATGRILAMIGRTDESEHGRACGLTEDLKHWWGYGIETTDQLGAYLDEVSAADHAEFLRDQG